MRSADVLVVDDDKVIRERICSAVDSSDNMEVMAQAGTLHSARSILGRKLPSLALIDLGLPDGSGISLINWLSVQKNVPSIVLTVFGDEHHVVSAVKAGASGYLLKCEDVDTVVSMLQQTLDGESPISTGVARHILKELRRSDSLRAASGHDKNKNELQCSLTPTELEVLQLVAKGYTSKEIAELSERAPSTVLVHIRNIYKKLSVHNRGEAVYEAISLGLVLQ
jgi:DNA-binding NarL/FixJ family response regulator